MMQYLFTILIISSLPFISVFFTSLFPHTHDGIVHLARMAAYYKALLDGQIPVRWAGDLNYGYGMPLFNFMYQLPYAISSFFIWLGMGLVSSFKITLFLSYLLSGISMFLFAEEFFQDKKKAFLITIFYQFSPFRLVELLIRGSFGEVYTYAFFPFVLYGITKLFKHTTYRNFFLTSLFGGLLILSHNALSLIFYGVSFLFSIIFAPSRRLQIIAILALLYGTLLSSFYWVPAILEHKYTYGDLFMKDMYRSHFVPIQNLFIPNFLNSLSLQTGGISVQIGLFHVIALIASIVVMSRQTIDTKMKKIALFSLALVLVVIFFTQSISGFFWQHLSLLRQFQFPWRFLGLLSFASSVLGISFFSYTYFKKKVVFFLVLFLTIISTAYYWRPPLGFDRIKESYYWNYPLNTTYFGETDLIWSAGPAHAYPKRRVDVISGKAEVFNFKKNSYRQGFKVIAQGKATLVDHTQYFPGWNVYIDGKETDISFQDASWRGEIVFNVPSGSHIVEVLFKENKLRFFSDMVSVFSLLLFFCGLVFFRHKYI